MNAGAVLKAVCLVFAVFGAIDYVFDSRFGLGKEFERGIGCTGKLIICMTGFMALAPVLGKILTPVILPAATVIGADPSVLAGILLSCDSGGVALAEKMCIDTAAGEFNGYIVGSMMGASVMCIIPMTILCTDERTRTAGLYGLIIGLITIPLGCLAGGLLFGGSIHMILCNLIPVIILSITLFMVLMLFYQWVLKPFQIFGRFLISISIFGLLVTAVQELTGVKVIEGLTPFSEIILVIGDIALVLAGIFPMLAVVMKLFRPVFARIAVKLRIEQKDMDGLLVTAVNLFPTLDSLNDMTEKGVLLNVAFMVSGNCMIGDHFAFTSQTKPELVIPVMAGKAISGFLAMAIALVLSDKLLGSGG